MNIGKIKRQNKKASKYKGCVRNLERLFIHMWLVNKYRIRVGQKAYEEKAIEYLDRLR